MDPALERAELAAMRVQWGGLPGASVEAVGGLHVLRAAGPPWLTQVWGLGVDGGVEELDEALARAPGALVPVLDGAGERALAERGYRPATPLLRMVAPAGGAPPGLRVERVGRESAALVADLAGRGFGLDLPQWWASPLGAPGWTQLVAYDGEVAVATGALQVAGTVGWLGAAATVPEARGRGAHRALLAARLRLAAEQGAERVTVKVEPGSTSQRNLARAGFVPAHRLTLWAPA